MPAIFNLWNVYFPGDDTCEFDVTMANAPKINQGTREFIAACLKALGVPNPPGDWHIRPFRSQFYSDYSSPGEAWEDRWARGWEVKVRLDGPTQNLASRLAEFPQHVDMLDETWDGVGEDPRHDSTSLLVAVFKDDEQGTQQIGDEILVWANRERPGGIAHVSVHSFDPLRGQLRVWFSDIAFPDWVPIGEKLKERCRELGGLVNRRDLDLLDG
jgi:hypothetical protein